METEVRQEEYYKDEESVIDEQKQCQSIYEEENESQHEEQVVNTQQESYQDETEMNSLNLKCKVDTDKLIREEVKQFIFVQEKNKIKNSTISFQKNESEKNVQTLKRSIEETQCIRTKKLKESAKDYKTLIEIKNQTLSTCEMIEALKKYYKVLEERVNAIKHSNLYTTMKQSHENTKATIENKLETKKSLITKINNLKLDSKKNDEKFNTELFTLKEEITKHNETVTNNIKILDEIKCKNETIKEKNNELHQTLKEKNEEKLKHLEILKKSEANILDLKLQQMENNKTNEIKKLNLEFEIDSLTKRHATSLATLENLKVSIEQKEAENNNLQNVLNNLETQTQDLKEDLKDMSSKELEQSLEDVKKEIEELNKNTITLMKANEEKITQICNEEKDLLKLKHMDELQQKEILHNEKTITEEQNNLEKLNNEFTILENTLKKKLDEIETQKNIQISLTQKEEQFKLNLEMLQEEKTKLTEDYNYKKNIVRVLLEKKVKDLEHELKDIEFKIVEKEKQEKEAEAVKLKKIQQYNQVRKIYSHWCKRGKQVEPTTQSSADEDPMSQEEKVDVVEDENEENKKITRGILKSPSISAPTTPTKSVTFIGVASTESSSSIEVTPQLTPKQEIKYSGRRGKFD